MPAPLTDRKRWRCPKAAVSLIHYCLDDRANGIVLLGLWSSYEQVDHLLTNIGFNNQNALRTQMPHFPCCRKFALAVIDQRPIVYNQARGALCRISRRVQRIHRNSHQTNVALTKLPSPSGWRKTQMKWRIRLRRSRKNTTRITIFLRSESPVIRVSCKR
jgi:hypothetical protein